MIRRRMGQDGSTKSNRKEDLEVAMQQVQGYKLKPM